MTALKDRFWAKVVFKEFIRHYRKMTAEQKAADIDESMDALEDLDDSGNSFGAKMVRWSMERVDQYPMAKENGKKGGRPRKDSVEDGARESQRRAGADSVRGTPLHSAPARSSGTMPADVQVVYDFAAAENMGRVPQNGTHPRIQGGDRAAQGAMSPSPSGAAQDGKFRGSAKNQGESNTGSTVPAVCPESGKVYDQETTPISTNEARQSRRTGGSSVRGMAKVAQPSVRSGRNSRCPNSREEFHAFVADNKLHEGLAEEWYAIHEAREWVDRDGNPIKDWKGALYNYCTKTEQKRRTA